MSGSLLRSRAYRSWLAACAAARLPITMVVLAMVLAGRDLGSFSLGAALAGVATAAIGIGALWRGRTLDRTELRHGLQRDALLVGAGCFVTAALIHVRAAPLLVAVAIGAAGLAGSGLIAGYRSLLPGVVGPTMLEKAYAYDAVLIEVCFVSGPALAGGLAYVAGPVGVLVAMGVFAFLSAWLAGALPKRPPVAHEGDSPAPAPWRSPAARAVLAAAAGVGAMIGLMETAVAPLSEELGHDAAFAGVLMAAYALGSGIGGVAVGSRLAGRGDPSRRAVMLVGLIGVLVLPISLAPTAPAALAIMVVCGLPFASANAGGSTILASVVAPTRITEGFALYTAAVMGGVALGDGLASVLLRVAPPRLVLASGALPVLAAFAVIASFVLRRSPDARPAPTGTATGPGSIRSDAQADVAQPAEARRLGRRQ